MLTFMVFHYACNEPEKLVLGGYEDGSIADYTLKVYPDSTFKLEHFSTTEGSCTFINDTIIFFMEGDTCAKVFKTELISWNCSEFRILEKMEFVKKEPPATIIFPKSS